MMLRLRLTTLLLALSTLALTTFALAAEKDFDRTLTTSATPSVHVNTGSGYIHLNPGSGNQVHVVAHLHSSHGWMSGGNDNPDWLYGYDAWTVPLAKPEITRATNSTA